MNNTWKARGEDRIFSLSRMIIKSTHNDTKKRGNWTAFDRKTPLKNAELNASDDYIIANVSIDGNFEKGHPEETISEIGLCKTRA
jgi:hypothetical protein